MPISNRQVGHFRSDRATRSRKNTRGGDDYNSAVWIDDELQSPGLKVEVRRYLDQLISTCLC